MCRTKWKQSRAWDKMRCKWNDQTLSSCTAKHRILKTGSRLSAYEIWASSTSRGFWLWIDDVIVVCYYNAHCHVCSGKTIHRFCCHRGQSLACSPLLLFHIFWLKLLYISVCALQKCYIRFLSSFKIVLSVIIWKLCTIILGHTQGLILTVCLCSSAEGQIFKRLWNNLVSKLCVSRKFSSLNASKIQLCFQKCNQWWTDRRKVAVLQH